jgi:hypothetical protein
MSIRVCTSLLLLLTLGASTSACAQSAGVPRSVLPPTLVSQPGPLLLPALPAPGVIRPDDLPHPRASADRADVNRLLADMREALGATLLPDAPTVTGKAMTAARAMMVRQHTDIDTAQVVLVVDRSPQVQRMWVTLARPGDALEPLGMVKVSTGKPGRKEHFRTPVGVFDNDAAILGYRALGTYNENHIRGVGVQGMRVWDFGWQSTDDWRWADHVGTIAIRMEMHATDPAVLEPRLGRWDSEGCIRIPSRFNSFLDRSGLIDVKLREAARDDRRFAALLPRMARPAPLAGHIMVIVDTSDADAPPSDPVRANEMAHAGSPPPGHDDAG